LKLPVISSSKWRSGIRKKKNVNVLTVLDFPEYKDVSIHTDLYSVIRGVCCNLSATSDSALTAFLNRCANSYPTVLYYLEHPQVARDRKDIYIEGLDAVLDWFESPAHLAELHSLSGRPNLEIQNAGKQFDGAPIFRGTTIAITGAFLHGTMDDIEHILSSYDATVVRTYCPEVRVVLIGDQLCDIDGGLVQAARAAGCKIFSESEFFQMHEIDQDLRNNLL
jgi:NAD-dependent DNA ligase